MATSTNPKKPDSTQTTAVSLRTALISGAILVLAAGLAVSSITSSDSPPENPTNPTTATTHAPDPVLIRLDEALSGAVNLSVAFAGSVQVLDRELRVGTIDGAELAGRAVAFEEQVTQSLTTVNELEVPTSAKMVKLYATEAMTLYQISTRLLQGENGVVTPAFSGISVRTKLLADRVFDRARVALDVATYGAPSSTGQRVLTSPAIPDFSAEAPDTGTNPTIAPATERLLSVEAWNKAVDTQSVAIKKIIKTIDWSSPMSVNEKADEYQTALANSTDALAISLPELSLTESARTLRLATALIEQAVTTRRIGATTSSKALLASGQRLWAIAADDAKTSALSP